MFGQYLLLVPVVLALALSTIRFPRLGAAVHGAAGVCALCFFRGASWKVTPPFVTLPLIALGALYWF